MKKLFDYLCVLFFFLTTNGLISAQDFTVRIESTDRYAGYIEPIKAGSSHQFQIRVTNNRSDTCTVSINKSAMGEVESWISIDNNSQDIFPAQSKNFLLTINVPASTGDFDYTLWLSFNAYDKTGFNHSFDYDAQTIIVDNSAPNAPTFTVSTTSKTIFVNSWHSWDDRSATYTQWNSSAGIGGIKSYKIVIKNPNGTVKASVSKKFSDYNYYTFRNLNPNTNYKASVTAFDLVGNSKSSEKLATTAPAKPSGLVFSNTTYISTKLSWNTSAGATGYYIYKVVNSTNIELNSSPVIGNSYTINSLDPNTDYKFNVIALSNFGSSDRSNNASVKTLALPHIIGVSTVCSGNYTYTVQNLLWGYTVSWYSSSNMHKQSASNSSAVFLVAGNGTGWIDANIIAPNGRVLGLTKKHIWLGKPDFTLTGDYVLAPREMGIAEVNYAFSPGQGITSYNWNRSGAISRVSGSTVLGKYWAGTRSGSGTVDLTLSNQCGSIFKYFIVRVSGGWHKAFPNPADDILTIEIDENKMPKSLKSKEIEIKIFDKMMRLKNVKSFSGISTTINVSDLKPDVYFLQIKINKEIFEEKIIISE